MFSASVPATAQAFFDRTQERQRIRQAMAQLQAGAPRWLCLAGPRKVGKTSLLLEVAREMKAASQENGGVGFVVVDVLDTLPVSLEFFRGLALQALDIAWSAEAGTSLRALARTPTEYRTALSGTGSFTRLSSELRSFLLDLPVLPASDASFVRACLELPEQLAVLLERHLVVAIDEFQELAGLASVKKGVDPLPLMRSVWQRHRRVSYIVSGSARSLLVELATSEHSPFFQHFALMDVGPFSEDDSIELLVQASADRGAISSELARLVYRTVGGHPFYLQVIGEAMTDTDGVPDERVLKESIQHELFSRTGRLALYFVNEYQRLVGRATTLAATLDCLAQGPRRLTDVAQSIGAPTGATLNYLERLGDAVVRTDEGLHALADPVFGLWLRWRQPGGSVLPMTLLGDEGERATAAHLAKLGFDLVYQSRGSRGAFDLLATRGSAQLGVQVKRKALPLRFSKTEWDRMEADARRYGWLWAVAAVDPDGRVSLLDPSLGKSSRGVTLDGHAAIENVLRWLDTASRSASSPKSRSRPAR